MANKLNDPIDYLTCVCNSFILPRMQEFWEDYIALSLDDIFDVFSNKAEIWNFLDGRKMILFFDELDTLLTSRLKNVCNSFLSNLRTIKTGPSYVIKSVLS